MNLFKKIYKYLIIIIIVVASLIFYMYEKNKEIVINDVAGTKNNTKNEIVVYVTGAVNKEGVYYCKKEARINDILSEAGGLKKEADLDKVNLAQKILDGDKIVIPYKVDETIEETVETVEKKINLNTADAEKLMEIPGVGESTANKIIEYREKSKFRKIEDIMNVPGIGEAKFEKLKELVLV